MGVDIEAVRDVTDETVAAVNRLLPQLSGSASPVTAEALAELVSRDGTTLLVAQDGSGVIGMLTLVTFRVPTGVRAWIEDVVVDERARGRGAGAALTREAVRLARTAGARTVDLTSRPAREAANRLYKRLGFQLRDTNLYRFGAAE